MGQDYRQVYANIERIFGVLLIFSACSMAFAHGANDIANAIGPGGVVDILHYDYLPGSSALLLILAWGASWVVWVYPCTVINHDECWNENHAAFAESSFSAQLQHLW